MIGRPTHAVVDGTGAVIDVLIAGAVGRARTEPAARDRAALLCGIGDSRLVDVGARLLPGSRVVEVPHDGQIMLATLREQSLGAVWADHRISGSGQQAWAGIGWVHDEATGTGLVVSHCGPTGPAVTALIRASLEDMQGTRGTEYGPIRHRIVGGQCDGGSICALAIDVFAPAAPPSDEPRKRSPSRFQGGSNTLSRGQHRP